MDWKNKDYSVEMGNGPQHKHYFATHKGVLAFYSPKTGKIHLRKLPQEKLERVIKNHNMNRFRVHRSGFKVHPRRSYEKVERRFPGYGKIQDEADYHSRLISHESVHKSLHRTAGQRASRGFDNLYARKGYHGIVRNKTRFIVGEAGPERVNITPIKPRHSKPSVGLTFGRNILGSKSRDSNPFGSLKIRI